MPESFELNSPFASLELDYIPRHWKAIVAAWFAFWGIATAAVFWFYVFVLPQLIGLEKTVLVGIAVIAIGGIGGDA